MQNTEYKNAVCKVAPNTSYFRPLISPVAEIIQVLQNGNIQHTMEGHQGLLSSWYVSMPYYRKMSTAWIS